MYLKLEKKGRVTFAYFLTDGCVSVPLGVLRNDGGRVATVFREKP